MQSKPDNVLQVSQYEGCQLKSSTVSGGKERERERDMCAYLEEERKGSRIRGGR